MWRNKPQNKTQKNPNLRATIAKSQATKETHIALKDDYHKKRMDMLTYAPVEYNCLETLAKTFIIPARQNQFTQENIFNMQEPTENCHYPELGGEPLRLELNFTQPLENVIELFVLGERMSSAAVDKFGVVGKNV